MTHLEQLRAKMTIVANGGKLPGDGVKLCQLDKKTIQAAKYGAELAKAIEGAVGVQPVCATPPWQSLPPLP
jgi:hypothetical protein